MKRNNVFTIVNSLPLKQIQSNQKESQMTIFLELTNILRANIMAYYCCKFITKTLKTSQIKVVALCSLFTYGAFELQDFWAHGFGFGGLKSK